MKYDLGRVQYLNSRAVVLVKNAIFIGTGGQTWRWCWAKCDGLTSALAAVRLSRMHVSPYLNVSAALTNRWAAVVRLARACLGGSVQSQRAQHNAGEATSLASRRYCQIEQTCKASPKAPGEMYSGLCTTFLGAAGARCADFWLGPQWRGQTRQMQRWL